jgi:nitronate monooxygenase
MESRANLGDNVIEHLPVPIVQAPMAGGPSTAQLTAAVSEAGGLGFVAAGYLGPGDLRDAIASVRAVTERAFGVNLFAPSGKPADPRVVRRYAALLEPEAVRTGVGLGEAKFNDDHYEAKLAVVLEQPPAVVSFTFGCPASDVIAELKRSGASVWITVTDPTEASFAAAAGADALVVQGIEAGGHRGGFVDEVGRDGYGLLALLQVVGSAVDLPLVATGGIATGRAVAAVLAAGADAAAIGSAFMLCPEAGTSDALRAAVASMRPTGLTRAFTGRLARGITNRLQAEHSADAPIAYPEVHYLTAPLRAHARRVGDEDVINLWAGQTHGLARRAPVAELVAELMTDAVRAAGEVNDRLLRSPADGVSGHCS